MKCPICKAELVGKHVCGGVVQAPKPDYVPPDTTLTRDQFDELITRAANHPTTFDGIYEWLYETAKLAYAAGMDQAFGDVPY